MLNELILHNAQVLQHSHLHRNRPVVLLACLPRRVNTVIFFLRKGVILQRQLHHLCCPFVRFRKGQNPMQNPPLCVSYLPLKPGGGSQLCTDIPRRKSKCWCFSGDRGAECQGGFGDSSRCHQFHIPHHVDCKRETSGYIEIIMFN